MIARQLKINLALKLQRRISEYLNRLRGIRLLPPGSESPALVSLAPRLLDSQEMSQYSEELKFAFEDDRNLNIALTGAYGAGKSSIIKTWEMAHPEKTVVHVELAHFANTGKVPNLKEAVNSASSDLATTSVDVYTVQGAILNQLIHKIELPKWNKSRFRKTQHVSWWRYLITALLLVAFVALTICSLPVLEDIASTRFQRSISWQETGILALWALLTVLLLAYALGTDMMSRFLRRVKLFGNEIELFDASGDSVFDRYMDDILYLIDCANLDAVVFEDLDRFDDIMPVFEKLRELNSLLNDSSQGCGKRIKFIYLLRDNFFPSAHERVKFFDIIIPVIPYVDPKNSYATLCAYCKNIGLHVSADILFEISLFIDDPRILADIVNETYHYKNALGGETGIKGDDAHRLGLIAYKVLFPDDFANLQVGCGYLHELFLKKETLLQERKEKLEAEIANEAGCLANLVEMENESEDVRILPWALTQMASTDAFDSTNVNDLFSEFEDPEELLRTIYADDELLRRFREAKEAAIESSETLRAALNDKGDLADKRRVIEGRISALRDELQECDRLSMVDLIAEDPDAVFSIALPFMNVGWSNVERAINDVQQSQYFGLIRFLVSSGLIDESFSRYITRYDEDSLPAADREYLAKALQRQSTDPAYPFVQPSNAVLQTTEKSFLLREMRNYSLFTELLQRGPQQKLERFIEGVVRDGDGVFVRNYLLSDPNDSSAIECFEKADRMLISRAIELESVRMDQTREVCQSCIEAPYFDSCGEETKHAVATFAGNDPLFFAVGDGEPCVMVEKLSTAGYIANALDFSETTKDALELIFGRNLYLPSMENIKGMLRMVLGVNAETEDADIFDLLETLRVEESAASLIELIDDNIDLCLSEYLSLQDEDGDGIEWNSATIEWVLNSENLTSKTIERLIKRFSPSVKVQLTSFSSKDTMQLLLAANAVLGNAANVMHYYRSCDLSLDETLANWFAENDIPDGLTCRACKETLGSNNGLLYNLAYSDRIDGNKLRDFLIKQGVRTFFRTFLRRPALAAAVLVRAQPPERALDPPRAIVPQVGVQHLGELRERDALPVPVVEELVLEPPEEPLAGRVVGAAPLGRHRAREPVLPADRDPPRPPVVAPAVAVHHGARPLPPGREGVEQRPVGERGRGPGADPPAGGAAVVAVHHGAQVDLAGGHAELGDVGDPQLVGGRRREVPGHQVRRGRRDLPLVGAPPPAPPPVVDHLEPLLPHQPAHDLLGRAPPLAAQARPYRAVAPVAAALLEQLPHPPAQGGVLVGAREPGPPVLIGAPRYPQESGDLSEGPPGRRAQSLAQLALSPVRHRSRVRACPF